MLNCRTFNQIIADISPKIEDLINQVIKKLSDEKDMSALESAISDLTEKLVEIINTLVTPQIIEGLLNDSVLQQHFNTYLNEFLTRQFEANTKSSKRSSRKITHRNNFDILQNFIQEQFIKAYFTEKSFEKLNQQIKTIENSSVDEQSKRKTMKINLKTFQGGEFSYEYNFFFEAKISDTFKKYPNVTQFIERCYTEFLAKFINYDLTVATEHLNAPKISRDDTLKILVEFISRLDYLEQDRFNFTPCSINGYVFSDQEFTQLAEAFSANVHTIISFNNNKSQFNNLIFLDEKIEESRKKRQIDTITQLVQELKEDKKLPEEASLEKHTISQRHFITDHKIVRSDLVAALNANDPHHLEKKQLLGELCDYNFRGQNIVELWDKICGDPIWNEHCQKTYSKDEIANPLNTITLPALIEIANHPYDFQFGIDLQNLPNHFGYHLDRSRVLTQGILYVEKTLENNSKLTPGLVKVLPNEPLSTKDRDRITHLPCYKLLNEIVLRLDPSSYYANWRLFADSFDILQNLTESSVNFIIKKIKPFKEIHQNDVEYLFSIIRQQYQFYINPHLLLAIEVNGAKPSQDGFMQKVDVEEFSQWIGFDSNSHRFNVYSDSSLEKMFPVILEEKKHAAAQVYLKYGIDGFNLLVQLLQTVESKLGSDWFQNFKRKFIDPSNNLNEFVSMEAAIAFHQLMNLTKTELHWWDTLCDQHFKYSGYGQFVDLMGAFTQFLAQLDELKLPEQCPFLNVRHLKVGLNRLLTIIQRAKNPQEQLQHLTGLSLEANAAPLVAQNREYSLVTKDMRLTPEDEIQLCSFLEMRLGAIKRPYFRLYNYFEVTAERVKANTNGYLTEEDNNNIKCLYFRKIGKSSHHYPYSFYVELAEHLELPKDIIWHLHDAANQEGYLVYLKIWLLEFIFKITTVSNLRSSLPENVKDPLSLVKRFITTLFITLRHKNANNTRVVDEENLSHHLPLMMSMIRHNCMSLIEVTQLLELINGSLERHSVLKQCHSFLEKYKTNFVQAISNFYQYNSQSDFQYYLRLIGELPYTFIATPYLIKLFSVVSIGPVSQTYTAQCNDLIDKFEPLIDNKEAYINFVRIFCSLRPIDLNNEPLTFESLHQIMDALGADLTSAALNKTLNDFRFKHLEIKKDPNDFIDSLFYKTEAELETKFQGLGIYYNQIKSLVFSMFELREDINNLKQWDEFLTVIQKILEQFPNTNKNTSLLNELMLTNWSGCYLTTVTELLSIFLKLTHGSQETLCQYIHAINPAALVKGLSKSYCQFLPKILSTHHHKVSIQAKIKLITLGSSVNTDPILNLLEHLALHLPLGHQESALDLLLVPETLNKKDEELSSIIKAIIKLTSVKLDATKLAQHQQIINELFTHYQKVPNLLPLLPDVNIHILKIVARTKITKSKQLHDITEYLKELFDDELEELSSLYDHAPYPSLTCLLHFIDAKENVETFTKNFQANPFGNRTAAVLFKQFDTLEAYEDLKRFKFEEIIQDELYQQIGEINSSANKIRHLSMNVIRDIIHEPKSSVVIRIAAAREALYRTSPQEQPRWPSHNQIICLLCHLSPRFQNSLFFKFSSDENNALLDALTSVVKWSNSVSGIILNSQSRFSDRDYVDFKLFFQTLHIPVRRINANSAPEDFNKGAIHYVEYTEFAAFGQKTLLRTAKSVLSRDTDFIILNQANVLLGKNSAHVTRSSMRELGETINDSILSSLSSKYYFELLNFEKSKPLFHGTASLSKSETAEMEETYRLSFIKVPKQQTHQVKTLPDLFCQNEHDQFDQIINFTNHYASHLRPQDKRYSILIGVESAEFAEKLLHAFKTDKRVDGRDIIVLQNGELSEDELSSLENSSQSKAFIVTPDIMKREFNPRFNSEMPHLLVVNTSLISPIRYAQQTVGIYDLVLESQRYPELNLEPKLAFHHPEQFKQLVFVEFLQRTTSQNLDQELNFLTMNLLQSKFYTIFRTYYNIICNDSSIPPLANEVLKDMLFLWGDLLTDVLKKVNVQNEQFTSDILTLFQSFITAIKKDDRIPYVPKNLHIKLGLADSINRAQARRKTELSQAISNANDPAKYKIHPKWHPHLGYLAAFRLNQNQKQPLLDSLFTSVYSQWMLEDQNYAQLCDDRESDAKKALQLENKKWQIVPLIEAFVKLKQKRLPMIFDENGDEMAVSSISNYKVRCTHSDFTLESGLSIILHYDPFKMGYGVLLKAQSLRQFESFNVDLKSLLQPYGFTELPVEQINVSDNEIIVHLNFVHPDHVIKDFRLILQTIAGTLVQNEQFNRYLIEATHLAHFYPVPRKSHMICLLQELKAIATLKYSLLQHDPNYLKIWAHLNYNYFNVNKDSIYSLFLPIVKIAINCQSQSPYFMMQALAHYAEPIHGKLRANKNLEDLCYNHLARSGLKNLDTIKKLLADLPQQINEEDNEFNTFIQSFSNLNTSIAHLNADCGVEVGLQILKLIGQRRSEIGESEELLLIAKKQRAIEVVKYFTEKFAFDASQLLKFAELIYTKHYEDVNPYAYIRQERERFRFQYGNTNCWNNIMKMIKSKLFPIYESHGSGFSNKQLHDYTLIMSTHRKHTLGFGWLFKPQHVQETSIYYLNANENRFY